jgi:hypothetical protein
VYINPIIRTLKGAATFLRNKDWIPDCSGMTQAIDEIAFASGK